MARKNTSKTEEGSESTAGLMSGAVFGEDNNFTGDEPANKKPSISPVAPATVVEEVDMPYSGLNSKVFVNNLECRPGWKALLYNQKEIILARTIGYVTEAEHVLKVLAHPELFDTESDPRYVVKGDCIVVVCKQADYDAMCLRNVKDWQQRNMPINQSANITESLKIKTEG
jgi:hypothetical protein